MMIEVRLIGDSFNACILFYALDRSDRPFAASLLGVHTPKLNIELKVYASSEFNSALSEDSCEKPFSIPSCDPEYYATLDTPTPPPRVRRSWLPPLKFQTPLETEHPALRSLLISSTVAPSQTNLLPSLMNPRQAARCLNHPGLGRSQTALTACSSIYSRSTSDSTWTLPSSAFSTHPGTLSSLSLCSHPVSSEFSIRPNFTSLRPSVPILPAQYRQRSHKLRDGGSPVRPGSRPGMPSAEFWDYVSEEQRRQSSSQHMRSESVWPGSSSEPRPRFEPDSPLKGSIAAPEIPRYDSSQIKRAEMIWPSVSSAASVSSYRTAPLVMSPDKAILRTNMNKGNTMKATKKTSFDMAKIRRKGSYEHVRKESQIIPEVDYGRLEDPSHQRKGSRTLVKQRQPWDPAPRVENRKKAMF